MICEAQGAEVPQQWRLWLDRAAASAMTRTREG
jgi:hypothetical protein